MKRRMVSYFSLSLSLSLSRFLCLVPPFFSPRPRVPKSACGSVTAPLIKFAFKGERGNGGETRKSAHKFERMSSRTAPHMVGHKGNRMGCVFPGERVEWIRARSDGGTK